MGSKRALSWVIDHDGVIRRSDAEISDRISSGMSAVVAMMVAFRLGGLGVSECPEIRDSSALARLVSADRLFLFLFCEIPG